MWASTALRTSLCAGIWDEDLTYTNIRLCVDSYKRRPISIEAVQEELQQQQQQEMPLLSPPLIKCCEYELLVDNNLSTSDVVFNEKCGPFDQEKYDELVENVEVGKMIVACAGFNKLFAWPGNACVDLFKLSGGGCGGAHQVV
ncbi:hypothetical protein SELMODRAFT_409343 [Selaginella moellendorffii]|uniref:Uncharacterized protein n=1 Tax=Selaginella moellendorffii TaxID=88036 RepID=D8RB56_SELML|nr:hypothetical protein SELMODRAFT_409343 [Selaginella moellendorffii]